MNTPYLSLPLTGEPGRADVWERLRKGKDADRPRATLPVYCQRAQEALRLTQRGLGPTELPLPSSKEMAFATLPPLSCQLPALPAPSSLPHLRHLGPKYHCPLSDLLKRSPGEVLGQCPPPLPLGHCGALAPSWVPPRPSSHSVGARSPACAETPFLHLWRPLPPTSGPSSSNCPNQPSRILSPF